MRCLNNVLEDFFYRYAFFVHRYPYFFVFIPILVTGTLSGGLYFKQAQLWNNTEQTISPVDGYAKYERKTFAEHFPLNQDDYIPGQSFEVGHWLFIIILAKDDKNSNLLREDALDAIESLNRYILYNHTVAGYDGLGEVNYTRICLKSNSKCFANEHILALTHRDELENWGGFKVRYPVTRVPLDNPSYLGGLLGSVTFNESDGRIHDVKAIRLVYYMKHQPESFYYYGNQFRASLAKYLEHNYESDIIDVYYGHEVSLTEGLEDNALRFTPEVGVTVILVLLFSYFCSFTFRRYSDGIYIDWVRSKPMLAVVGTIEPGLAIISTMGLLLLIGAPYNDIIVVMPFLVFGMQILSVRTVIRCAGTRLHFLVNSPTTFLYNNLVLAIGVDDMFIMISSWHNTKFNDPPEKRFAEALSEAGVAITITSVTDVIAFSVGTWNPIPAIQMYCYYTAVAMAFELIYQCTFYAAALYLIGRCEAKSLHCMTWKKAKCFDDAKTTFQKRFCVGTIALKTNKLLKIEDGSQQKLSQLEQFERSTIGDQHSESLIQAFFRKYYGPILLKPLTKVLVAILFIAYIAFSVWGVLTMPNGLEPSKLVHNEHHARHFLTKKESWNDGLPLQVLVANAPNITTHLDRIKLYDMIRSLENTKHTLDSRFTMFWLKEYDIWLNDTKRTVTKNDSAPYSSESIKKWLRQLSKPAYWNSCLQWGNETNGEDPMRLKSFRFTIGLKDYSRPSQHQVAIVLVRNILTHYPEYNMTCSEEESPYVDQYIIIYSITIRNTLISLAIIIFITMLLIPHPVCGIFMTISVLSIDVGVSGFLSWWNVNMDCISMVGMIMATGFAIDFSAHISYAYVRAKGTVNERAIKALETLGWPVFQGVTATFLGILVMATVETYMFEVFFKTVFLVILLGLLHSIVFLPVALTGFIPESMECYKKKNDRRGGESPVSDASTKEILLENNENGSKPI